jgi:DNA ligase 1
MLLADLVATSAAVATTSKRTEKVAALAALLGRLAPDEVEPAVGFLTGVPRQGRIGIGWATLGAATGAAAQGTGPPLTIGDLDQTIDELMATTGAGSVDARQRLLADLLARAGDDERDFVWRLLTGELRQGALEGVMTDAVSKAAGVALADVRRAAMFSGDLGRAAAVALTGGASGLARIGLTVLHPVQPMLAKGAATLAEAVGDGPVVVEWKLDGARIQVHRAGEEVRVFTRNLNDVTARLPAVVDAALALPVDRFVLDGEAIGLDDDLRPQRFQDTMSTFGSDAGGGLRAFFFDVLHADGDDLVDRPLAERLAVLDRLAPRLTIPRLVTADATAADAFAADALRRGHEGVVVKALDAPYDAGRRGGAWRKVKPVRLLDLVVLAAEWGHGRRRGWLSNLHLGAREPSDGSFVMVGKTFKGLTDQLLTWQTQQLQARAIGEEGHIVHVRPELVVEIALDGVQVSRRYPGGVALRFARVRRYRDDKQAEDADTIDTVRALL